MIIAIDGTASSGKSTLAKRLAKKMGFVFCNTGAIYRALTIKSIRAFGDDGYLNNSEDEIVELLKNTKITEGFDKNGEFQIIMDGEDVSKLVNTPKISVLVPYYSKLPKLREIAKKLQKEIATKSNSVVEGRDIGTVVFPNAEVKFFVSARPEVRAMRRMNDYINAGKEKPFEEVLEEIKLRDKLDMEREISPLKPAEDSIIIDNSGNDPEAMVSELERIVKEKLQSTTCM